MGKTKKDENDENYFFELFKIAQHFFTSMVRKLKEMNDPRHASYIKYGPEVLLAVMVVKHICGLDSMRKVQALFDKQECVENIKRVLGIDDLDRLPHYDTINNFLSKLDVTELEHLRTYMIKTLLEKRSLEHGRLLEEYWCIAIDATGVITFNEKHCDHCLTAVHNKGTENERTTYMHPVLEAKLVIGDMVFSMGTEFIENESEGMNKQDCELKAFYRLIVRLKETYKRLPICMLGDSLYACEPVIEKMEEYKWKYVFRFKEKRIPTVAKEFKEIKKLMESEKRIHNEVGGMDGDVCWVKNMSHGKQTFSMVEYIKRGECKEEDDTGNDKKETKFVFLTNIYVTGNNAMKIVDGGRSRWKIENQGFNMQKNHQCDIEHANSHNYNAMKCHYIIAQISDILMQLFRNGSKLIDRRKRPVYALIADLFDSFRNKVITKAMLSSIKRFQVRFG